MEQKQYVLETRDLVVHYDTEDGNVEAVNGINLKLEPLEGELLRGQYADIKPGYYMNKVHWNAVDPDGKVPDDLLKTMLDKSYTLVLKGLTKKKQAELLGK